MTTIFSWIFSILWIIFTASLVIFFGGFSVDLDLTGGNLYVGYKNPNSIFQNMKKKMNPFRMFRKEKEIKASSSKKD